MIYLSDQLHFLVNILGDGRIHDDPDCLSITGYTIIRAMSLDAATQLAKNCLALKYGSKISVYETMNAM